VRAALVPVEPVFLAPPLRDAPAPLVRASLVLWLTAVALLARVVLVPVVQAPPATPLQAFPVPLLLDRLLGELK
jgi:hypothetical protein